jgi:hypothetical protein
MRLGEERWTRGRLVDGVRSLEVAARFDSAPDTDDEDDGRSGVLRADAELPVGKAASLRLEDGRRALVVVVDERGRFLTSGPVWDLRARCSGDRAAR